MNTQEINLFTEKKTRQFCVRFKPTIHAFLMEMADKEDLSMNEMIEIMVLQKYSSNKNSNKQAQNEAV